MTRCFHRPRGSGLEQNVALWALNKSILIAIIDYGLEGPWPSRYISGPVSHSYSQVLWTDLFRRVCFLLIYGTLVRLLLSYGALVRFLLS